MSEIPSTTALKEGDMAPDFKLPCDTGETACLSDLRGKKNVLVYFYPKDDTPGCTCQAKGFTEDKDLFAKVDTVVVGVSKDDLKSHGKFRQKFDLTHLLASDKESDMCERYGVWKEKSMYGKTYMGIERTSFLIDKQGRIAKIWPKVKAQGHARDALEAAQELFARQQKAAA